MNVDLDKTPCVFAHPKLNNLFYCSRHSQGMTQNIAEADRFVGAKARIDGVSSMLQRFPNIKRGQVLFTYLT